ncbi:MAG: hypothetical protein PVF15_02715 [Candidatus Bathyarchaeota archaeon]|jgi:hypothetical protein
MSSEISKEILNFLLKTVESCINELVQTFFSTPYMFYTENDLHCYFYRLLSEGLEDAGYGTYETLDKKLTNLLHKEYPTKKRYRKPVEDKSGKRGHFDLCIWNPEEVDIRLFRSKNSKKIEDEQQTYFAFEFLLLEGRGRNTLKKAINHTKWDMLKLRDNEVKYGYLLLFARDWSFREDFLRRIKELGIPQNVALVYAESSKGQSIFETL